MKYENNIEQTFACPFSKDNNNDGKCIWNLENVLHGNSLLTSVLTRTFIDLFCKPEYIFFLSVLMYNMLRYILVFAIVDPQLFGYMRRLYV
jgi:hypothetical protein